MREIKFIIKRKWWHSVLFMFLVDPTIGGYMQNDFYQKSVASKYDRFYINIEDLQIERWRGSKRHVYDFVWSNQNKNRIVVNCDKMDFIYLD